jgi:CheY-like chemotaxis protein
MQLRSAIRVMVIDDDVDAADTLCQLLELLGCSTAVGYDGAAALEISSRFLPHVAFVDFDLQKRTGAEVARAIRAEASAQVLICLTGHRGSDIAAVAMAAGFDRLIAKPLDEHTLREILEAADSRPAAVPSARSSPGH